MLHMRKDYQKNIQAPVDLIPEDEPVILFRAGDKFAKSCLTMYAEFCEESEDKEAKKVARRIRDHLKKMEAWDNGQKTLPFIPAGA